ncbi:uncharacterized protein LOC143367995 [Andrena cerasifolii]|uniref:uncharacterized protein LOC143367995 n=1 Tax=Andrena cerasifolii TaxID=2819439 RepID=UPI004038054D
MNLRHTFLMTFNNGALSPPKQERACPLGTGQRRPSRSPRSQRSRSADVDCLKKYTERRVEERRHTEVPDTSKLDPSRWIPLPKTITRAQPATKKPPQPSRDEEKRRSVSVSTEEIAAEGRKTSIGTPKKLSPTVEEEAKVDEEKSDAPPPAAHRTATGRSHSADVSHVKSEKHAEERRHTECSDSRMIATRWLPQINTSRFRYDASPFARITNSCEITKNAAARWMAFVKNPSPSPVPRVNTEGKPCATGESRAADGSPPKDVKSESPKWEPVRKFSSVASKGNRGAAQGQDETESDRDPSTWLSLSPDSSEQSIRLTQRMRDLYDFKTENEWPKRAANARRENAWISKSSSEEDRTQQPCRRNSQDLEFNDRMNVIKLKDTKVQSDHQEAKPTPSVDARTKAIEVLNSEYEERLRKFNDRIRYSEDLGLAKPKIKERRTYSDDYDEKSRRASARSTRGDADQAAQGPRLRAEKKRDSDASGRSRGSYAEVATAKRDSRTSDSSSASVCNHTAKQASVDCKSTRQMVQPPPRRAFSQTEERLATPVPPVEWNDDRYAAARLKLIAERQKRDSTRYKVYLT